MNQSSVYKKRVNRIGNDHKLLSTAARNWEAIGKSVKMEGSRRRKCHSTGGEHTCLHECREGGERCASIRHYGSMSAIGSYTDEAAHDSAGIFEPLHMRHLSSTKGASAT